MSLLLSAGGAGGSNGDATGSLPGLSLSSFGAVVSASALAVGLIAALSLAAPSGTAQASALATGGLQSITLTVPQGSGTGSSVATGSLQAITLAVPTGAASGTAFADGSIQAVSLANPSGTATGTALATGSLPTITQTSTGASAQGDAVSSGQITGFTLTSPEGFAEGTAAQGGGFGGAPVAGLGWIRDYDHFLAQLREKRISLNVSKKQEKVIKKAVIKAAKKLEESPEPEGKLTLSIVERYASAGFKAAGYEWESGHRAFLAEIIKLDAAIKQNKKLEAMFAEQQETERKRLEMQRKEADIVFVMMMLTEVD